MLSLSLETVAIFCQAIRLQGHCAIRCGDLAQFCTLFLNSMFSSLPGGTGRRPRGEYSWFSAFGTDPWVYECLISRRADMDSISYLERAAIMPPGS